MWQRNKQIDHALLSKILPRAGNMFLTSILAVFSDIWCQCVCVCVCLCLCVRVNVCMGLCVRVVKTEAAPGCPAYTQTVPSLNHLTVPSTIHCPEHVFHLMCVLVEMKDTRGEENENKNAGVLREDA